MLKLNEFFNVVFRVFVNICLIHQFLVCSSLKKLGIVTGAISL